MAKRITLENAKPTDLVRATQKGAKYWEQLNRVRFTSLSHNQRTEWNILFDLSEAQKPLRLGTLLYPGRDSSLGRILKRHPALGETYESALQSMILRGLVVIERVKKDV